MAIERLLCASVAFALGCSSTTTKAPVHDAAIDVATPDLSGSPIDGADARDTVRSPDAPSPVDAATIEVAQVEVPAGLLDASPVDVAIDAGLDVGGDADPGGLACAQSTTSARVVMEVPASPIVPGAVYGASPDDVWVSTLPHHEVVRWNGLRWTRVSELAGTSILSIAGAGKSDVWLGGAGGALWHWDGTSLSRANSQTTLDIQQISVVAGGQAFALALVPTQDGGFDLLRLAGTEWSVVAQSPAPSDLYYLPHDLYAPTADEAWVALYERVFHFHDGRFEAVMVAYPAGVWGTAPDNIWFGFARWDGRAIVAPFGAAAGPIWGTGPTDMWLGTTHWDGQSGDDYGNGGLDGAVVALRGLSATDVWATTVQRRIVHFDASRTWHEVIPRAVVDGTSVTGRAQGIWQVGPSTLWITGEYDQVYAYDGGALAPVPGTGALPTADLLAAWGSSTNDLWAVGESGSIVHGDGTGWTKVTSPTTVTLRAISGSAEDDVWAVGDGGTVLHRAGDGWSTVPSNRQDNLLGVWTTAGYVVAVGANGTIVANDGKGFIAQTSGSTSSLVGVWGRSPADVYAADGSNLFVYDGATWTKRALPGPGCVNGVWGTSNGIFANGYYVDPSGTRPVVPRYPPANHNGALLCLDLFGVWAGSASDFWSVGGPTHLLGSHDSERGIYRFNGECIEAIATNLFADYYATSSALLPSMRGIFGLGEHDLWAVGDLGMIAHIQR